MNQAQNMINRQREYQADDMVFLTVLDDTVTGIVLEYEVRNLLLHRPRLTIKCRRGTAVRDIASAITANGWNEETFNRWWRNNGEKLAAKRMLV